MRRSLRAACTLVACVLSAEAFAAQPSQALDAAIAAQGEADAAARASQDRIDALDDQTQSMSQKYRQALENTRSIKVYADNLRQQVQGQRDEMKSMQKQLEAIETTKREVFPLMVKMVDKLAQFVALDTPFRAQERTTRVNKLKELLPQAGVTQSEKYRRILEAYQIETEYGRTLDTYEGSVKSPDGGQDKNVTFLRVGRIALIYQTPDRAETGYWDAKNKTWVIDNGLGSDVFDALRVAQKKGAPQLLVVPLPAPVEAN